MQMRFEGVRPGDDSWAEQRFKLPDLREVWIEIVADIPTNYVHREDTGANNNKLVRLWTGDLSDGNDGYSKFSIKGGFSTLPSADGSHVIVEWGRTGEGVGRNNTPAVPLITAADKGKRIKLVIHAKVDETGPVGGKMTPTGGNGVLELWKDGRKIIGYKTLSWRSLDGKREFFARGYLWGWANSGFAETTNIHVLSYRAERTNLYGVQ
jgi:hypothetical protein